MTSDERPEFVFTLQAVRELMEIVHRLEERRIAEGGDLRRLIEAKLRKRSFSSDK